MPSRVSVRTVESPRKPLGMRADSLRKPLADPELARVIGAAIDRALSHAQVTKQEASYQMGYSDQSAISRWIAGVETPQFAKLWTLGRNFQRGLVIALAEAAESDVEIRTVVTLSHRASA